MAITAVKSDVRRYAPTVRTGPPRVRSVPHESPHMAITRSSLSQLIIATPLFFFALPLIVAAADPPPSAGPLRPATASLPDEPWKGTYAYDGAGNVIFIGANHYLYDGARRLMEATAITSAQGDVRRYVDDAFGNL